MADTDIKMASPDVPIVYSWANKDELACTTVFDWKTFMGLNFKDKVRSLRQTQLLDPWIPDEGVIAEAKVAAAMDAKQHVGTTHHFYFALQHLKDRLDHAPVDTTMSVVYRSILAHALSQRNNPLVQYPMGVKPTTAGFIRLCDALGPFGLILDLIQIAWEYSPDLLIHDPPMELTFFSDAYGRASHLWQIVSNYDYLQERRPMTFMAWYIADLIKCHTNYGIEGSVHHSFRFSADAREWTVLGKGMIHLLAVTGEFQYEDTESTLYICPACMWSGLFDGGEIENMDRHYMWCPGMGGVACGPGLMSPYFIPPRAAEIQAALSSMDCDDDWFTIVEK